MQKVDVGSQLVLFDPFAHRTDNVPAARLPHPLHNVLESSPFLVSGNAAGHTDMFHIGHEHEIPARKRHIGRDPRAFRADGSFGNLHHQLLPLTQQLLDRLGALPPGAQHIPILVGILVVLIRIDKRVAWLGIQ